MTLGELARRLECPVEGDAAIEIRRVAKIEDAGPGDLTFLANPKYASKLASTRASAVIMNGETVSFGNAVPCAVIRSKSPYLTFARAAQVLSPDKPPAAGVHPLASISADAKVDPTATVGAFAVIGSGASIGARTVVHPHVVIGDGTAIGADCILHAHVSIRERCTIGARVIIQNGAVVGSDGYGFAQRPDGTHEKIPQTAPVVIEDDVEIGAHTCVDRAALGRTRIGRGTKLDNMVHVGHNCDIGERVVIAAQTGISGSVVIEDDCVIGGQVGFGDHTRVMKGAIIGSKAGILPGKIVRPGVWWGIPVQPLDDYKRMNAHMNKLAEMRDEIKQLRQQIAELRSVKSVSSETEE